MMGKAKRLRPKLFYTGVSLESRIPQSHPLRRIKEVVDFGFVRKHVAGMYGERGNPSMDPAVLLKMMFLTFYEGVRSERALSEQMPYRLDWLWFCDYDLDDETPNHSVLSKARRRWGKEVFTCFFQKVLRQCVEAGLVDGKLVHVDASVIRANASMDTLVPESLLIETGQVLYNDLEEAAPVSCGEDKGADEGGCAGQRPEGEKPGKAVVSTTDPDARLTRREGETILGYKDHRVVDDRCGVVTATVTTDASVAESHILSTALDAHRFNTGCAEETVVADRSYGTMGVYREVHDRGATPCIPHQKWGRVRGTFGDERFVYDAPRDCYVCPAGCELHPMRKRRRSGVAKAVKYHAKAEVCRMCAFREQCTLSENGRIINRPADRRYVEWADGCLSRHHRRYLALRRRVRAEGSFADAANLHGFKRARWRGKWKAAIQNLLIATIQNVRKLLRYAGGTCPTGGVALAKRCQTALIHGLARIHAFVSHVFQASGNQSVNPVLLWTSYPCS